MLYIAIGEAEQEVEWSAVELLDLVRWTLGVAGLSGGWLLVMLGLCGSPHGEQVDMVLL